MSDLTKVLLLTPTLGLVLLGLIHVVGALLSGRVK